MSPDDANPAAPAPLPTVVLRHECPDGNAHYDWLLARDTPGTVPLITFRTLVRPDELAVDDAASIERIADHRPRYLTYEGPISGNRGTVTRVARGVIVAWRHEDDAWILDVRWAHPAPPSRQRLRIVRPKDRDSRMFSLPSGRFIGKNSDV